MKSLGQSYWTPIWIVSPACKHLKWWIFAMKGWGTCHLAPSWPHSYLRILKVLPRRAGAAPGRLTGMELFTDWDRKSRSYELYTYIYIYIIYNICNMYTKYVKIHMMGLMFQLFWFFLATNCVSTQLWSRKGHQRLYVWFKVPLDPCWERKRIMYVPWWKFWLVGGLSLIHRD